MEYDYTASGIVAAALGLAGLLTVKIGRWVTRQRWTHTIQSEDTAKIAAEREALQIKVHELELRTAAAEARECLVTRERDRLIRRIAGLEAEEHAASDDQ